MQKRESGALERAVLLALSAASEPMSVAQVQSQLPGRPAYTTVMPTLSRLTRKGVLTRCATGGRSGYSLAVAPEWVESAVTARRMRRLLSGGGDRAGVLASFVAELDTEEERLLTDLLRRSESEKPSSYPGPLGPTLRSAGN